MITRRNLLRSLLAAPAVVAASSIMPVRLLSLTPPPGLQIQMVWEMDNRAFEFIQQWLRFIQAETLGVPSHLLAPTSVSDFSRSLAATSHEADSTITSWAKDTLNPKALGKQEVCYAYHEPGPDRSRKDLHCCP